MFDYYKKYHSTHDFINVQTISLDLSGSNSTPSILFHSPNINFPFSIGTVSDELKNIWILQPSKNDIGELDIIIENNDKYSSFHLFGSQLNQEQRNRAIEISKSVK